MTAKDAAKTKAKETTTAMDDIPLIPREVLFGNPQRAQARLSPDGKWLSFQAPVNGVMNVWVGPADDLSKAKPVTEEKVRPVPMHQWAYDNKHILYIQDKNGDENFHLYATNVETRETRDLTPIEGVRAEIQEVSHKFPNEILVGLNDRDPQLHDIWRINIQTGEKAARAAKSRRRRLSHRRRLQRPALDQLHAHRRPVLASAGRRRRRAEMERLPRSSAPRTP